MRKVVNHEDKAVSPIIATVLLVGITVTMIATAYTLLENYIPNPAPNTPSANLKAVYDPQTTSGPFYNNYTVYINSLNGNVSVKDVSLMITLSNNQVFEIPLEQVYANSNSLNYTSYVSVSLQSSAGYLTSTSSVNIYLHDSQSKMSRISLLDTFTDGSIGSITFQ